MNDAEIIRQLREGRQEALAELLRRYGRYVAAVIGNLGRDQLSREDIEELASDTFVALWRHAAHLRETASVKGYLAQIARNKTIDYLRKKKLVCVFEEDWQFIAKDSPDGEVLKREQAAVLNQAVGEMAQDEREIFVRFYYFGEKIQAIAQRLNANPATIKTKLHRGRKKLRELLEERGFCYDEG